MTSPSTPKYRTLAQAYDAHLGYVLAISPARYGKALDAIAESLGRVNDEAFRAEVRAYENSLPSYED